MQLRYNPGTGLVLTAIFLGMGAMLALVGSVLMMSAMVSHARSDATTGIVVAFSGVTPPPSQKGPPPQPSVAPVVVFTGADGSERRFTARWHSSEPAHALGDRVPVRYLRSDPASAWIDSFAESWLLPLIFSGLGGAFLMIGWLVSRFQKR